MCSASTKHDYAHTKTHSCKQRSSSQTAFLNLFRVTENNCKVALSDELPAGTLSCCFHTNIQSGQKSTTTSQKLVFCLLFSDVFHKILVIETSPFCLYDLKPFQELLEDQRTPRSPDCPGFYSLVADLQLH